MSIRFIEGWDVFQAAGAAVDANFIRRWTIPDGTKLPSTQCSFVAGRLGGLAIHQAGGFSGNDPLHIRTAKLANADRYVTVGFAFRKSDHVIGYFNLLDALGNSQAFLQIGETGGSPSIDRLSLRKGDPAGGSTLLGSYDVDLGVDWHYIEMEFVLSTSTVIGQANLYIDGAQVLSIGGVATATNDNGIGFLLLNQLTGGAGTFDLDDMYVASSSTEATGFQGDCSVEESVPTGDGTVMDAVAVGAANPYQCVDDPANLPDDDATYAELTGTDKVALFGFPATTDYEENVLAVEVEEIARTSAGVNPNHFARVYRSGEQASPGTSVVLAGTYDRYSHIMEVDPLTNEPWTVDNINASEFGIRQT